MHRALKRLASRGNGRWRGMATAAKESMEGEKVYYSQVPLRLPSAAFPSHIHLPRPLLPSLGLFLHALLRPSPHGPPPPHVPSFRLHVPQWSDDSSTHPRTLGPPTQSGCWMTVPGTAGLRVMELSLAGLTSPDPSLARALASTGVSTVLLPPIDAPLAAHTSALAKSIKQGGSAAAASVEATPNGSRELRALDAMLDAGVSEAVVRAPAPFLPLPARLPLTCPSPLLHAQLGPFSLSPPASLLPSCML